jgi:hypothetical protein
MHTSILVLFSFLLAVPDVAIAQGSRFAVRFFGTGTGQKDRIKIPLASSPVLNVGGDFTFEFWMRAAYLNNAGTVAVGQNGDGWITGNAILDRDVYGGGDYGDFGLAVGRNAGKLVLAFGAHNGTSGQTIVGTNNVGDDVWHHVAITRVQTTGLMRIFVNGVLDASGTGPTGNLSYRIGRSTSWPNSDPFLVIGAEKHDAGSAYPSFRGYFDELRVWSRALTAQEVTAAANRILPPVTQTGLVACFRLEEGQGTVVRDVAMGNSGTLIAGSVGNGEWTSWGAGGHAAPVVPFVPVLTAQANAPGTLDLSWFVQSNFRFTLVTSSNLADSAASVAHPVWTNIVAGDSNATIRVEADAPRMFYRVHGGPYR